jgi:hypothetical protein
MHEFINARSQGEFSRPGAELPQRSGRRIKRGSEKMEALVMILLLALPFMLLAALVMALVVQIGSQTTSERGRRR